MIIIWVFDTCKLTLLWTTNLYEQNFKLAIFNFIHKVNYVDLEGSDPSWTGSESETTTQKQRGDFPNDNNKGLEVTNQTSQSQR